MSEQKQTDVKLQPQQPKPLYRDSLPRGTNISEATLPKISEQAGKPARYEVDNTTRRIINTETLGLTTREDDPKLPNLAVLDVPTQTSERVVLQLQETKYEIFSSHLRQVVEEVPPNVEIKAIYDISGDGAETKVSSDHVVTALKDLIARVETDGIKYLNCSFASKMPYSKARQMMAEYGPPNYTGIIGPDTLRADREVLAEALKKYLATDKGKTEFPNVLEEAELFQKLIDKGVVVLAGAGNDGRNSFNPVHVLVPNIVVVAGLNGGRIHNESTDHSLVDTAESYFSTKGEGQTISGTSLSTPSALSTVDFISRSGVSIPELNEVLLSDFNIRVRGKLNSISLPMTALKLDTILNALSNDSSKPFDATKVETTRKSLLLLSPRDFDGESHVLEAVRDHPNVSGDELKNLIKGLSHASAEVTISKVQFREIYEKYAALTPEKRSAVAQKLSATKEKLNFQELMANF